MKHPPIDGAIRATDLAAGSISGWPPPLDAAEVVHLRQVVGEQDYEIAALREERRVLAHRVDQLENTLHACRALMLDGIAPSRLVDQGDGTSVLEQDHPTPPPTPPAPLDPGLEQAMRKMAQFHPVLLTLDQLATLTGLDPAEPGYATSVRRAIKAHLLARKGNLLGLAHPGFEAIGVDPLELPRVREPAELAELWRPHLPQPADRMLQALAAAPAGISRPELAAAIAIKPNGGHFRLGLRALRAQALLLEADSKLYFAPPDVVEL